MDAAKTLSYVTSIESSTFRQEFILERLEALHIQDLAIVKLAIKAGQKHIDDNFEQIFTYTCSQIELLEGNEYAAYANQLHKPIFLAPNFPSEIFDNTELENTDLMEREIWKDDHICLQVEVFHLHMQRYLCERLNTLLAPIQFSLFEEDEMDGKPAYKLSYTTPSTF